MKPTMGSHRSSSSSTSPTTSKRPRTADSSGPSLSPSVPRVTQRAPQSCLECTRRKIKCNKELPCSACISRGEASSCRREAVLVKGALLSGPGPEKLVSLQSLTAEVEELRRRVALLEDRREDHLDPRLSRDEIGVYSRAQTPGRQRIELDQGRLPSAMEDAALGIGEPTRWLGSAMFETEKDAPITPNHWFQPQSFEFSLSQLPSQPQARAMVQYYLDNLAWTMGVVHAPTFWTEFTEFWTKLERLQLKDDAWLGVLFAVISVSAYFMEDQQAIQHGFTLQQLRHYGLTWFNSALATALRCHILTEPTLTLCQLIQVLYPSFHLSGNTPMHQSLTTLGKGMGRYINLHLLGSRAENDEIRKMIGRRIWWNDVEGDWAFLPYNRYSSYTPFSFNTAMPKPFDNELGGLLYREICHRTARLLYDVYGLVGPHEIPSYDRVMAASAAIQSLREGLPTGPTTPVEITQNRLVHMTLAYRSYQIHRLFFIRSITSTQYASSKTACLSAAETILAIAEAGLPPTFYLMWNVAVMMVAAGLVMALELIHANWNDQRLDDQRARLRRLIDRLLGVGDQSGISTRGANLIDHLLLMEAQLRAGRRHDIKLSREAILEIVHKQPTASSSASFSLPLNETLHTVAPKQADMGPMVMPQMGYNPEMHPQSLPFGAELDLALLWDDFFATS